MRGRHFNGVLQHQWEKTYREREDQKHGRDLLRQSSRRSVVDVRRSTIVVGVPSRTGAAGRKSCGGISSVPRLARSSRREGRVPKSSWSTLRGSHTAVDRSRATRRVRFRARVGLTGGAAASGHVEQVRSRSGALSDARSTEVRVGFLHCDGVRETRGGGYCCFGDSGGSWRDRESALFGSRSRSGSGIPDVPPGPTEEGVREAVHEGACIGRRSGGGGRFARERSSAPGSGRPVAHCRLGGRSGTLAGVSLQVYLPAVNRRLTPTRNINNLVSHTIAYCDVFKVVLAFGLGRRQRGGT